MGSRWGNRGPERPEGALGWDALSSSELRVIELVCEGLTNPEIGERLYISRRTVQTHLYNVFKKLGVTTRAELATRAREHGLVAGSGRAPDSGNSR